MNYRMMILLNETADQPFHELLRRLKWLDTVDVSERPPRARLGLVDGRAVLWCAKPDVLFDWIEKHEEVAAFSMATGSDLAALNGADFAWNNRHVRVRYQPDVEEHGPYARRIVKLDYAGIAPASNLKGAPRVIGGEENDAPELYASPLMLTMTSRQATAWFDRADRELALTTAVCLPAWRASLPEDGYFAEQRRAIRSQIRKRFGLESVQPDEPAALSLWRLLDSDNLTDVFLEGGHLDLAAEGDLPTGVAIQVFGLDEKQRMIAYRARFWLDDPRLSDKVRAVATACRADVRASVPGPVEFAPAVTAASWTTTMPPKFDRSGPTAGTWHVLQKLAETLDDDARDFFDDAILSPARARHGGNADHAQAERRFVLHLASGLGPASADDTTWVRAVCTHLLPWFDPTGPRELPVRLGGELTRGRFRLERVEQGWRCIHRPGTPAGELRRWRLALPLGTVLVPDSGFHLDDDSGALDGDAGLSAPVVGSRHAPVWRKHLKLSASDLWKLEQDFLDRVNLESLCSGLEAFEIGTSLRVIRDGETIVLTARELSGLTPSGQQVVLYEDEELKARLPMSGEPLLFDASIVVAHEEPEATDEEAEPPRLQLLGVAVEPDAPLPAPDPHRLDLGRFEWKDGAPPHLVARPRVRHFAAIGPLDDAWVGYVAPLTAVLDALLLREPAGKLEARAHACQIAWLASEWPTLRLPELARRLRFLAFLGAWRAADGVRRDAPDDLSRLANVAGPDLPTALAKLTEPALKPPARERLLTTRDDYDAIPDGQALVLKLRRRQGTGRLQFRCARALPDDPPLMLRGSKLARDMRPSLNGHTLYESRPLLLDTGSEVRLSPLRHVWDGKLLGELYFVEEVR